MKTKIIIILAFVLAAMSIALNFTYNEYRIQKSETERQKSNVEVLNKNFKSYKNAHGQSVAQVEALKYTVKELKNNENDLYRKLKANKIDPKRVKSVAQVATTSHIEIKTEIQYVDTNKCFSYENDYYTVNGCFDKDSAAVVVETRDSLDIIPEIVPKRFLFIKYGVKGVKLNVISNNPFSKIVYSKYIEIKPFY